MGLFYRREQDDETLVLTVNPLSYLALLLVIATALLAGPLGWTIVDRYTDLAVLVLAIWYSIETWPVIRANWTEQRYEKTGAHQLSFSDPLEYRITQRK